MDPRPFTLRQAINGIRNRKRLVVSIFGAILVLVGAVTLLSQKKYRSEAKIFVRLGRENIGLDPTMTLGEKPVVTAPMSREAEINSIGFMIKSHNLFEAIVDQIGVDRILTGVSPEEESDNQESSGGGGSVFGSVASSLTKMGVLNDVPQRERAIIKLSKGLSVKTLERSNVLKISYEANDPTLAQDVVNCLIEQYQEWHVKMHRTSGTQQLLESQFKSIAEELTTKEKQLELFKSQTGMISATLTKEQLVSRLGVIRNHLLEANIDLASLEKEVGEMQSNLDSLSPTHIVSKTVGAGNQGVDGMRQELFRQEIELESLLAKNTAQHPRVVELRNTIAKAKEILELDESSRTESVVGNNPIYEQLLASILTKRPLLESAKAKALYLTTELEKLQSTIRAFNDNQRQYDTLTREVGIADEKYRRYQRSLAQARVDFSLEENRLSNISVSQPATFAEKPVRPNKLINLILGIMLGLFGSLGTAVLLEYMAVPACTREEIESTFSAPVIATVPRVSRQESAVRVES